MHLYKTTEGFLIDHNKESRLIDESLDWDQLINNDNLRIFLEEKWETSGKVSCSQLILSENLLPPIGNQEVWAAGVTYYSSRLARMEESQDAGGGDFYSRVYQADRPEIFFKATPSRVVGHNQSFRIRQDSSWDVPEPELTLFATSSGKIVAYTIGNDVSSRSIEGENPLYLPQAKTYDKCACLGPGLYVPKEPLSMESKISIEIIRSGENLFSGHTTLSQMKRTPEELIGFLFRETSFEKGVFLMTGTGVVPGNHFSLQAGDTVSISIDLVGNLVNSVE
jgi:2-dehydro-3-deoxy-D-arabinonate dehydratase